MLRRLAVLAIVWGLPASTATVRAAESWPQVVTDGLGRSVRIERKPLRVVSMTPANTEILFALGAGDRVVGVTSWCTYPEEAKSRPKIGGFAATTIHLEAVVVLRPDLVIAGDEAQSLVAGTLAQLGIPVLSVKVRDFAGLYAVIGQVGQLVGEREAAETLVGSLRRRVEVVVARSRLIPPEKRLRVYWEVFDAPVMSAGRTSMVGQLIELAGGINVFADVREEYPQVNTEAVVARNPEVILGADMTQGGALTVEILRARPGWSTIAAVREGRIHTLPADPTSRPGPRLVDGLEKVAAALYPQTAEGAGR